MAVTAGIPRYLPVHRLCQPACVHVHVCACKRAAVQLSVHVHASVSVHMLVQRQECVGTLASGGVAAWGCLHGQGLEGAMWAGGEGCDVGRARGCRSPQSLWCSGCWSQQVTVHRTRLGWQPRAAGRAPAHVLPVAACSSRLAWQVQEQPCDRGATSRLQRCSWNRSSPGKVQGRAGLQPLCALLCCQHAVPAQAVPAPCLSCPISAVLTDSWASGHCTGDLTLARWTVSCTVCGLCS